MNKALFLGVLQDHQQHHPRHLRILLAAAPAVYDPAKARKLLAEAGYPNGFDAGPFYCDSLLCEYRRGRGQRPAADRHPHASCGRSSGPAFLSAYADKKLHKGIFLGASGAFGNAATRLASFVVKGGAYVYGSYPDIDELYPQQADELDKRSARQSCIRCSSSCTRRRYSRRSGSSPSSTASVRGSASRPSA